MKIKKIVIDTLLIVIGTYMMGLAINLFLLPNQLTTGGATGIATIFYYIFSWPVSLTVILINIPLFIIAIIKLGTKFCLKSIFATGMLTLFLETVKYTSIITRNTTDLIVSSIYGGLILGIGISLVFKAGASTGGTDLVAQIIKKSRGNNLNVSNIMLIIDSMILVILLIAFKNLNCVLYSIIAIYIQNKIVDLIFDGINYSRIVNVITDKNSDLVEKINVVLERGATVYPCIGGYTNEEKINITCIVNLNEIGKIKTLIKESDSEALIYITSANQVYGNGFRKIRGDV